MLPQGLGHACGQGYIAGLATLGRTDLRQPLFQKKVCSGGCTVEADTVLYATGFRAAIDHLTPLGLREPGVGIRLDRTRAVRDPRAHLVGYGPSAGPVVRTAVRGIRKFLRTDLSTVA
ncbi:oxidoreductase [Streptomyces paromomycinus]|uniref:Oxidoreductase n=1 Tax=Streptomyces paromomycinus TaxID=92743 RepID=A0A401VYS4_STREY|nr:oxidoreductase [Streptomyces paromomycinus]